MLEVLIDVEASANATNRQNAEGMVKIREDLDRYWKIIEDTKPDLIIECGSWQGSSALWFSRLGISVVSIDLEAHATEDNKRDAGDMVTWIIGDSVSAKVVSAVKKAAKGKRVMVVLDSDHRAEHVRTEIKTYGPLVSPGCYLVVEDGIVRWMPYETYEGPLHAIEDLLLSDRKWERDIDTEQMHPVSMHPAGWWRRKSGTVYE